MSNIIPFQAIRPVRDKAHLVASRSIVTYAKKDLRTKLHDNPFTFIHIINPEFDQPVKSKPNSAQRLKNIRSKYESFVADGVFQKEDKPAFYIYNQQVGDLSYYGIISGISVDDYVNGKIKLHEKTLTKREKLFTKYLDHCGFNAEPVLLTYPDQPKINGVIDELTQQRPEYDFTTTDRVLHRLWVVDKVKDIKAITAAFKKVDSVYIADGHHRSASSARLSEMRRKKGADNDKSEHFLCYLIPESQLTIYDFNRLIKDCNGLQTRSMLNKIRHNFDVTSVKAPFKPSRRGQLGMYINKTWYQLDVKPQAVKNRKVVDGLDAEILDYLILKPILNIQDSKTNPRIKFIDGLQGMEGIENVVDSGKMQLGFALFPASIEQVKAVADANEVMPPKSTWIEPKLRSGLTIYEL